MKEKLGNLQHKLGSLAAFFASMALIIPGYQKYAGPLTMIAGFLGVTGTATNAVVKPD